MERVELRLLLTQNPYITNEKQWLVIASFSPVSLDTPLYWWITPPPLKKLPHPHLIFTRKSWPHPLL